VEIVIDSLTLALPLASETVWLLHATSASVIVADKARAFGNQRQNVRTPTGICFPSTTQVA
jgi:hypothetical protein